MTLRTNNGETAGLFHFGRQLDIRTTTGHVRCDGHNSCATGLGNDLRLLLVELGVEDIMRYLTQTKHLAEQLGYLDGSGTDEDRTTLLDHRLNLVDDGIVFLALGAIDAVVHIVAGDGFVGRNNDYIQFVDIPELTRLGLGRTGHTRELVVHTEIVLQGNGCKGLGSPFDLHVLLRLNRLVQTVRPAATFHHTTGLLIDDLHFTVVDDIVHIFLEERVGLEQLVHGVHALGLDAVIGKNIVFLLLFLVGRQACLVLKFRHLGAHIGQHEEVGVIGRTGQGIDTFVGQLDGLVLLVDDEVEFVGRDMHVLLVLLEVELLGLLHTHLDTRFGEEFNKSFALRHTLEGTEERQLTFFFHFLVR